MAVVVLITPSISVNYKGLKTERGSCKGCLTECVASSGNASELYLGGDRFESRHGHQISRLRNVGIVPQIRPSFLVSHPIIQLYIV
jgi:hypothetical protein